MTSSETAASVVRENCGALAIGLAEDGTNVELRNMSFPEDSLRGRALSQLTVRDSHFQASSLAGTKLSNCLFRECRFERLEIHVDTQVSSVLEECSIATVVRAEREEQIFDPVQIRAALSKVGFKLTNSHHQILPVDGREPDEELWLVERVMRIFLRANQVNEDVIRMKLGVKASNFLDNVLSDLLRVGMLEAIPYVGAGKQQRRFKMRVQMEKLHDALADCGGEFEKFLALVSKG